MSLAAIGLKRDSMAMTAMISSGSRPIRWPSPYAVSTRPRVASGAIRYRLAMTPASASISGRACGATFAATGTMASAPEASARPVGDCRRDGGCRDESLQRGRRRQQPGDAEGGHEGQKDRPGAPELEVELVAGGDPACSKQSSRHENLLTVGPGSRPPPASHRAAPTGLRGLPCCGNESPHLRLRAGSRAIGQAHFERDLGSRCRGQGIMLHRSIGAEYTVPKTPVKRRVG